MIEKGQIYTHQNGLSFEILCVGVLNSVVEDKVVVVHQGLHDGRVWVRDMDNFTGLLRGKPRFEYKDLVGTTEEEVIND